MAKFYSSAVPEYQADKEQFEFVQMKDDIADATFQDKPIGFFKDAMLRFCRSKVSIVAFVGIVIILFMAIFMPMMSRWHYNDQDLNRINLPPKMPVLENVGILDGTRWLTNRRVDSLEDTTRYPEGSILKVINYRKVQGVDMVTIDFIVVGEEKNLINVPGYALDWTISLTKQVWFSLWDLVFTDRYGVEQMSGPVGVAGAIGESAAMGLDQFPLWWV